MTDDQIKADLDRILQIGIRELNRDDRFDEQGRYVDGTYKGMTHEEVLADRELYRRLVGE